jgi:UDP-N-acetylmuramoylalanine--D-glutamate ligase
MQGNIKVIVCIGEIRHKLATLIHETTQDTRVEVTDLQDLQSIVKLSQSFSEPGDVVLLSPACASFDMFKNFYDRGDQFRSIVNQL